MHKKPLSACCNTKVQWENSKRETEYFTLSKQTGCVYHPEKYHCVNNWFQDTTTDILPI